MREGSIMEGGEFGLIMKERGRSIIGGRLD
jgi:hypothetical protein